MTHDPQFPNVPHFASENIWIVRGTYWRLPVSVTEEVNGVFIVVPAAIPMLAVQREQLASVLDAIAFTREPNRWRLIAAALGRVATPWERDAESAVVWNPAEVVRKPRKTKRSPHWMALRGGLVRDGWFPSEIEAELAMHIICEAMMSRLVNDRLPVDLGFCTLLPSPRTPNFPDLVNEWCRTNKLSETTMPQQWTDRTAERIMHHLCNHELTAVAHSSERVVWTMIVMPAMSWWEWTARREARIFQRLGEDGYKHYISECLKATLPDAIKVVESHRKKKAYAPPRRRPSFIVGNNRPAPKPTKSDHADPGRALANPPDGGESARAHNAAKDLARARRAMSEMPDLQQDNSDVRDAPWSDVDQPKDGPS